MSATDGTIVIQYSGWCRISDAAVLFQYTGVDELKPGCITGADYRELNDDERAEYVPMDVYAAIRDSQDNELTDVQVIIDE